MIDAAVGQPAQNVDPAGLADAIEALFACDLAALSQAARQRAETRHTWDATFEGLSALYARLITGHAEVPLALSA